MLLILKYSIVVQKPPIQASPLSETHQPCKTIDAREGNNMRYDAWQLYYLFPKSFGILEWHNIYLILKHSIVVWNTPILASPLGEAHKSCKTIDFGEGNNMECDAWQLYYLFSKSFGILEWHNMLLILKHSIVVRKPPIQAGPLAKTHKSCKTILILEKATKWNEMLGNSTICFQSQFVALNGTTCF